MYHRYHTAAVQLCLLQSRYAVRTTRRQHRSAPAVKRASRRTNLSVVMTLGTALPHMQKEGCIYLDYNATTPIFPEVRRGAMRTKRSDCFLRDQTLAALQVSKAMEPYLKLHFG